MASGTLCAGFVELLEEFTRIFQVPVVNGFVLGHTKALKNGWFVNGTVMIPACEVEVEQENFEYKHKTTTEKSANVSLQIPFNRGSLLIKAGEGFTASCAAQIVRGVSLMGVGSYVNGIPNADVAFTAAGRFASLQGRYGNQVNSLGIGFGLDETKFGVHGVWRNSKREISVLINLYQNPWFGQFVASIDNRYFIVTAQRHFPKLKWTPVIGTTCRVSEDKYPTCAIAWKLKVNNFDIHSIVNTDGWVRTGMSTKLSRSCTVGFYESLNHFERRYRCGLSLQFQD